MTLYVFGEVEARVQLLGVLVLKGDHLPSVIRGVTRKFEYRRQSIYVAKDHSNLGGLGACPPGNVLTLDLQSEFDALSSTFIYSFF